MIPPPALPRSLWHVAQYVVTRRVCSAATIVGTAGVTAVRARNLQTGETRDIPCAGFFVAIGHAPASELVKDQLELHSDGYVKVEPGSTATSIPGVFAAGDLTDHIYRQAGLSF